MIDPVHRKTLVRITRVAGILAIFHATKPQEFLIALWGGASPDAAWETYWSETLVHSPIDMLWLLPIFVVGVAMEFIGHLDRFYPSYRERDDGYKS